jgi:hypothetical protein
MNWDRTHFKFIGNYILQYSLIIIFFNKFTILTMVKFLKYSTWWNLNFQKPSTAYTTDMGIILPTSIKQYEYREVKFYTHSVYNYRSIGQLECFLKCSIHDSCSLGISPWVQIEILLPMQDVISWSAIIPWLLLNITQRYFQSIS